MSTINKKEIEHIAKLARIRLTSEEEERMAKQLGSILGYFEKLNELKTDDVEPAVRAIGLENVLRPDEPALHSDAAISQKLIALTPDKKDNYLKVKNVF